MGQVGVPLDVVHADRATKAGQTGSEGSLPESPAAWRVPGAKGDKNSGRYESASESCAVMRNQRNQPGTDLCQPFPMQSHEVQVLRDEDDSHSNDKYGQARGD